MAIKSLIDSWVNILRRNLWDGIIRSFVFFDDLNSPNPFFWYHRSDPTRWEIFHLISVWAQKRKARNKSDLLFIDRVCVTEFVQVETKSKRIKSQTQKQFPLEESCPVLPESTTNFDLPSPSVNQPLHYPSTRLGGYGLWINYSHTTQWGPDRSTRTTGASDYEYRLLIVLRARIHVRAMGIGSVSRARTGGYKRFCAAWVWYDYGWFGVTAYLFNSAKVWRNPIVYQDGLFADYDLSCAMDRWFRSVLRLRGSSMVETFEG